MENGGAATWYVYTAILMAAMIATYVMFMRSYRNMRPRSGILQGPGVRYYFLSIRSREAEELLEHAASVLKDGDYARAIREARDAVAGILAEACRRLSAGCEGEAPAKAASTLYSKGYYAWPQGARELEELARRSSAKKGDADRAIEIALRIMASFKEIKVEPPRKAVAGQEGNKVPGSS